MKAEILRPDHFARFDPQPAQRKQWDYCKDLVQTHYTQGFAVLDEDERLLMAVGWTPRSEYVLDMWAGVASHVTKQSWPLFKFAKSLLNDLLCGKVHRLEGHVQVGFAEGVRLMQLLGFQQEGVMRCFGHDKTDYYLFAKVRD
jgi:hypothetical protein